jgi:hypothetical protein
MKRVLEEDETFQAQCNAASENLVQLSRQWVITADSTRFTRDQVLALKS